MNAKSDEIRAKRMAARWTQKQLADAAGVTLRTVQRYEASPAGNPFQRQHVLFVAQAATEGAKQ